MANRKISAWLGQFVLWAWLLVSLIPVVFMVVTSLKPPGVATSVPPSWSFRPTLDNYAKVLTGGGTGQAFAPLVLNSVIVTVGATILTMLLAVPAAYALSLREFRPRRFLSSWILSTYMFPPMVSVVPLFILAGNLGLFDTYPILIVPYAAINLPIAVWILRSSILQIPYALQEAAMLDGLSRWGILRRVLWPLLVPSVATAAILTAILSWNEFLLALSLTRQDAKTAPVGIMEFTGMFGTDWGLLTAASTVIVAPIVVLTLILRRRIVSGLTFGAVK
ncbi:carbohydrate ABC transporter permease [Amycolatopsis acidiphila]|uniref:Carbohydrate ABC transporter permease n=1 Tax=Amycolatopsis acidiphila TaxID=715473 RepID=A0A558AJ57_9PSEU|nr:carbohydrate ABC transporter permease [Amycolatopsis acidiphila]TVT24302.1 carbohydrate ABC transporter permease [Amycolatopsis acidiphila]UIJ62565.1 carbohydrate ABC transporter permease [Amycolatopsis acidiphila]GHG85456.1 sugar ABC transporter permease [Amycolatopsis acidiphila]